MSVSPLPIRCPGGWGMKLTSRNVTTLALSAGKTDVIYWDDAVPGFGLRIRQAGGRGWVYRYRFGNLQRSVKLGSAGSVPLATARENASKLEAEVRLGGDPAVKKELARQEAQNTFALLAERFLDARRPELREATLSATFGVTVSRFIACPPHLSLRPILQSY